MNKYLLDSDIVMDFFKKKGTGFELIPKLAKIGEIFISVLTIAELRSGWSDKEAKVFIPRVYKLFKIEVVNKEMVELAGKFRWEYKSKGISLPTIDSVIAATAIVDNCELVTRNSKNYPMPGIKLYSLGNLY